MTTILRGCQLWRQSHNTRYPIVPISLRAFSFPKQRVFSSSNLVQASKNTKSPLKFNKAVQKAKAPSAPSRPPITAQTPPIYQPFAVTLARKTHPTILYQAPSHTLFIISCYGGALLCFSYAAFHFHANYLQAPEGLAPWVPLAFVGVCAMATAFGVWVLLAPASIVRTITAIPQSLPATRLAAGTHAARVAQPELKIEIELRKLLPFFQNRKIYALPKEMILPRPLAPNELRPTAEESKLAKELEEKGRERQLEYERTHIMSSPFRHAGKAFMGFFSSFWRAVQREGFMKMDVRGQTMKIDVMGGWALDKGRALDRLATVKSTF